MASTRLDLPLLPSAEQIRRRMFARVRRGFDPDQVHDYLMQIADQIETLEDEVREARLTAEAPEPQPAPVQRDPVSEMADRISDIVRTADRHAQERRAEVAEESRTILAEARAEADRIRLDAQSRAEELRQESSDMLSRARAEADRALGSLAVRRQDLLEEFRMMRERLLGVANDLEAVVDDDDDENSDESSDEAGGPPPVKHDRSSGNGIWDSNDTVRLPVLSPTAAEDDEEPRER
jgi:DivIVA domain-containing protein